MKKIIIIIIIIIIVVILLAGAFFIYFAFFEEEGLSSSQQEIVDTFGYPKMFTISYLPYSENDDSMLVRHETWVYPEHQQEITFIGGEIATTEEIEATEGEITYSDLKPENFEFEMSYDEVVAALGNKQVERVDMVPELYDEDVVETYISDHVIFTIEYGYLTYIETVGLELSEEEEEST